MVVQLQTLHIKYQQALTHLHLALVGVRVRGMLAHLVMRGRMVGVQVTPQVLVSN